MSNKAITWAYSQDLKPGPKFLLVVLADMADSEGSCFPGVETLSEMTGYGRSAVKSSLAILKELGLITEERRHRRDGSRTSNRYWLRMSGQVNLEPESEPRSAPAKSQIPIDLGSESDEPRAGIRPPILEPSVEPSVEPSAITRVTPTATEAANGFFAFWDAFPLKKDKPKALAAWKRAIKRAAIDEIVVGAVKYRDDPNREDGFTKWPEGWLNGDRWNDGPLPARGGEKLSRYEQNMQVVAQLAEMERNVHDGDRSGQAPHDPLGIGSR